jgi:hypothetical protein
MGAGATRRKAADATGTKGPFFVPMALRALQIANCKLAIAD